MFTRIPVPDPRRKHLPDPTGGYNRNVYPCVAYPYDYHHYRVMATYPIASQ